MNLKIVPNSPEYYSTIKNLRLHPLNIDGFIEQSYFSNESHIKYMEQYGKYYYIAIMNEIPVGFVGSVDNDIRVAVDPDYKNLGIGKKLIDFIVEKHPYATAKIKYDNIASIKLFESCNFNKTFILMQKTEEKYVS
jgi:ribosomal protein S18 acetylase RimI-like enzyme